MTYWLENRPDTPENLDSGRIIQERVSSRSSTQEQAIAVAQERANESGVQQVVFFSWKTGMYAVTELHAWVKPGDYGLNTDSMWDDCYDEVIVTPDEEEILEPAIHLTRNFDTQMQQQKTAIETQEELTSYSVDAIVHFNNPQQTKVNISEFKLAEGSCKFGLYEDDVTSVVDDELWLDLKWYVEAEGSESALAQVQEKLSQLQQYLSYPEFLTTDYSEATGVYNESTKKWEIS